MKRGLKLVVLLGPLLWYHVLSSIRLQQIQIITSSLSISGHPLVRLPLAGITSRLSDTLACRLHRRTGVGNAVAEWLAQVSRYGVDRLARTAAGTSDDASDGVGHTRERTTED